MAIAITATYYKLGRSQDGVPLAAVELVITGLTGTSANAISLTSNGTNTGTPLLPASAKIMGTPVYIASATGGWFENAVPSLDGATIPNIVLNLTIDGATPTAFRVGLVYGC